MSKKRMSPEYREPENVPSISEDDRVVLIGKVTTRLNVRFGPSMTEKIITVFEPGTMLDIIDPDIAFDWCKVSNGTVVGFCMKQFIELQ